MAQNLNVTPSMDECLNLENKAIGYQMEGDLQLTHRLDSLLFLVYVILLVLSVITIWTFKHRRFQYFHETGLSVIYGLIVGIALRYGMKPPNPTFETHIMKVNNTTCESRLPPEKVILWMPSPGSQKNLILEYSLERALAPSTSSDIPFNNKATFNPEIFFNVLLPPIIFTAGYSMKRRHFFKNIGAILVYAFFGTFISALCVGGICYLLTRGLSLATSLSFADCLFFGSMISATDPVTVLAIFNDLNVDVNLYALVFGESVLNDALAIALSQSVDKYGSMTSGNFDQNALFSAIGHFLAMFCGSFAIGVIVGFITAILTKFTHIREHPLLETALFMLMSYSTFLLCETIGFTGIVAVLFCGITQAHYTFNNLSDESKVWTKQIFELLNFLSENFLFAYLGVSTFTFQQHYWDVRFVLIALFACILARAASVYPLSALINLGRGYRLGCPSACSCCRPPKLHEGGRDPETGPASASTAGKYQVFVDSSETGHSPVPPGGTQAVSRTGAASRIPWNIQHMLFFSGLRGAMAFSLAIRNTTSEIRQMFFSTTIVVVMVTVLLCGGLVTSMLKWLKIPSSMCSHPGADAEAVHSDVIWTRQKHACLTRLWSRFDTYYLKPLLTNSRPPLTESLPWCCFGLANLLTTDEQRMASANRTSSTAGQGDDRKNVYNDEHPIQYLSGGMMEDGMPRQTSLDALFRTASFGEPENIRPPGASLDIDTNSYPEGSVPFSL